MGTDVDVHTEAATQAALRPILDGCTVFIVVHRPSTVALADRSILLDEGRLVAVGTHHDLLETEPAVRDASWARRGRRIRGHVELSDVWLSYVPGHPVLRGIDLMSFDLDAKTVTSTALEPSLSPPAFKFDKLQTRFGTR